MKTEKTPLVGSVQFGGMPAHTSTDGLLNTSSNVILHFRLHSLERMSTINFALAICSLVYLAINIVMIVFNWTANFDGDCDDPDSLYIQRCGSPISEYGFHMMEFWATFGFAIIEAYALLNTPKTLSTIYESPLQLKLILFFDIVASLVPSVLITFDIEHFEILSHELEYGNELTMSFVDLVILASLLRVGHRRGCQSRSPEIESSASRAPAWTASLLRNAADARRRFRRDRGRGRHGATAHLQRHGHDARWRQGWRETGPLLRILFRDHELVDLVWVRGGTPDPRRARARRPPPPFAAAAGPDMTGRPPCLFATGSAWTTARWPRRRDWNTIMYGIHRDCTACSARSTTEFQLGITPTASSTRTAKKKKAGSNGEGVLASVEYSSIPRAGCDHDREFSVP